MLNKLKKLQQQKSNEGFTIIEVMIVLAIAGLIILIVLLAVPALQRNGRNTAIKNDAGAVLGAISDFSSNNEGAQPTSVSAASGSGSVTVSSSVAGLTASTGKVQNATTVTSTATIASTTPAIGAITVVLGAKCPDSVSGASVTPVAAARSAAVIYAIESSSTNLAKCIGS